MNDSDESPASAKLDSSVPHSARVWNYWLGGKDNFQADRAVGDQFEQLYPDITVVARAARAFRKRAGTFLATEAGIRQFLDVGTGMPTAENTHQVAQAAVPEARIVYVDNDPLVLVHARALLTGTPEGVTEYVDADLRDPAAILKAASRTTLDLSQPTGLILMNILGHVPDLDEAVAIVRHLVGALPRMAPTSLTGPPSRRRSPCGTPMRRCPTTSATPTTCPGSSPGWRSWNQALSRARSGARRRTPAPRSCVWWMSTGRSRASRSADDR